MLGLDIDDYSRQRVQHSGPKSLHLKFQPAKRQRVLPGLSSCSTMTRGSREMDETKLEVTTVSYLMDMLLLVVGLLLNPSVPAW